MYIYILLCISQYMHTIYNYLYIFKSWAFLAAACRSAILAFIIEGFAIETTGMIMV